MLTSCSDSDFEYLNISFNESKLDGVGLNSNSLGHCIRKKGGKKIVVFIRLFYLKRQVLTL